MTRKLGVAVGVIFTACCSSPTSTTPPTLRSLRIVGPTTVAPGQTVNYSALGTFSDGSTKDYTPAAAWHSSATDFLSISKAGAATGIQAGEALIVASLTGASASLDVLVLPTGTFRLTGNITETGVGVGSATVTVTTGTGAGLSTTSFDNGFYRLYGVAGAIQVQIAKAGYDSVTSALTVTSNSAQNFELTPATPEPNLAGTYAMTLTADPNCVAVGSAPTALPADVRQRHYQATITQNSGFAVKIVLGGASFVATDNNFSGRVTPVDLEFAFGDPDYYYSGDFGLAETVGTEGVFTAQGSGTLGLSGGNLSGGFDGLLGVGPNPGQPYTASCSGHHALVLALQSGPTRIRR